VARTYAIAAVRPVRLADGKTWSDHQAFWSAGYPAVLVVQDLEQRNPANHTTGDTVARFAWPYYVGAVKALLGAVALEAGMMGSAGTGDRVVPAHRVQDATHVHVTRSLERGQSQSVVTMGAARSSASVHTATVACR